MKKNISFALNMNSFPKQYRIALSLEEKYVQKIASGVVVDLGCGDGRIIPYLDSDKVTQYIGLDIDSIILARAKQRTSSIPLKFVLGDISQSTQLVKKNSANISLCLFTTLGIIEDLENSLREIAAVSKEYIFITLAAKGGLATRLEYYKKCNISHTYDEETETISSPTWGSSKAFSKEDLQKFAQIMNVELVDSGLFEDVLLYALFKKL